MLCKPEEASLTSQIFLVQRNYRNCRHCNQKKKVLCLLEVYLTGVLVSPHSDKVED